MNPNNALQYIPLIHAYGQRKQIELNILRSNGEPNWILCEYPDWSFPPDRYRVMEWSLPRQLFGYRELTDAEEWHRQDFVEADLKDGWRPLLKGEVPQPNEDQWRLDNDPQWRNADLSWISCGVGADGTKTSFFRTRRPLPETAVPKRMVPWNSTRDFPKIGALWLRTKNDYREYLVIGIANDCAFIMATCGSVPVLQSHHVNDWRMDVSEWSGDRETWMPCMKEEA